jgi:TRAP-type C4-dicarboxylate transport system substrate-binding protein
MPINRSHHVTALLVLLSGLAFCPPAAAQVVIKLGTIAPEGSVWHDALLKIRQAWRDQSGGKVDLRIYAGGVLGGEEELVRKLQRQSIDAVTLSGAGLHTVDPAFNCLSLPMLFNGPGEMDRVRDGIAPVIEKRLESRGIVLLNWAVAGVAYFFSKQPLHTPDDLRRGRIWMPPAAPYMEKLYKDFGVRAIPLPATEMLTGLQTGLIDIIVAPPLFALLDRTYQAAGNMTDLEWGALVASTLVNAHAWARVPSELQPVLMASAQEIGHSMRDEARRAGEDAIRQMQARGLKVIELTPAERALWRAEVDRAYPALRGEYCVPELYDEVMLLHQSRQPRAK